MSSEKLDILCFGAHPDDVEIGMASTIKKHVDRGYTVGICDLTMAELSSNGTVNQRQLEAEKAAQILGVSVRVNLGFPDRCLELSRDVLGKMVSIIRQYKPTVVFLPFEEDSHPDHGQATRLVEEAVFTANIRKYQWHGRENEEAHKVSQVYYYFINGMAKPQLLVDTTSYVAMKKEALLAYSSQFSVTEDSVPTRINQDFLEVIEGRDRWFGKMIDVSFAEGFIVKDPMMISDLIPTTKKGM